MNFFSGILLVITIQPGKNSQADETSATVRNVTTIDTLMDLVRNMFPPNLVQACISQHRTIPVKQQNNTSSMILLFIKFITFIANLLFISITI